MQTKRISLVVVSLLLVAVLLLASCGPKPADRTDTLVMLDWSGYEIPEFWYAFASTYPNVKVEFSFMSESADSYAKMVSGFQADLVHPCSNYWKIMVDEGMAKNVTTTTMKDDIYAFIFGQKGLMAGLGIQGNKITKINPK